MYGTRKPGWNRGPSRRGYGLIRDLAPTRERKTAWWNGDFSARRRLGDDGSAAETDAPRKPDGLAAWTPKARIAEAARAHNAELRTARKGVAKATRRVSRRVLAVALVLAIAGAALAYTYFSNRQSGTIVVTNSLALTGGFTAPLFVGTPQNPNFVVSSNIGSQVSAVLVVNWSRPSGSVPSDVVMVINGATITPTCALGVCTYTSAPFTIVANQQNLGIPTTATVTVADTYTWNAQVDGN